MNNVSKAFYSFYLFLCYVLLIQNGAQNMYSKMRMDVCCRWSFSFSGALNVRHLNSFFFMYEKVDLF